MDARRAATGGVARRARRDRLARAVARRMVTSTVVAGIAPFVTYLVVRPQVESNAMALAITFAVPVAWAGFAALWHGRLDLDGSLTIGAYGLALVVTVLSGGSALPLELRAAAETGAVGVACLVSVVLRQPLLLLGLRVMARRGGRRNGKWHGAVVPPKLRHTFSVVTVIVGVGFLIEAASQVALALVLPTLVFVAVSLPVRFAIYGGGAGLYLAFRGHGRAAPAR
jgi:hypothetical protein